MTLEANRGNALGAPAQKLKKAKATPGYADSDDCGR
jgi:hypothetical protein